MKLNLKDEPKEWRKSALLLWLAGALIASLLRWRQHLSSRPWLFVLALLALAAGVTLLRPRWFRGYHLFSMRLGFAISRVLGRVLLTLIFAGIITPLGWLLRRMGKDPLQLRRPANADSYWSAARECGPLDRSF
ncbi:MAG TPA: hypothetical protein VL527_05080 [Dongiaceae bacterium]|jgi:hypothetical protein|nr:hypothetical protein [Dongiaceae bacterium]